MSLRTQWRDLSRATARKAPESYGIYELGDADGTVVELGMGVLRDEVKEALAYGEAEKVRWKAATSKAHAEDLLAEHR